MITMKITLYYGSVREEREGIKAARFIKRMCEERGHEVAFIDPIEYKLPLLERKYNQYPDGEAPEVMKNIANHLSDSDAVIVVSAEYNHGVPPALKNLIDHFMEEYFWKPSGIVTYSAGGFGGVRADMKLRSILPEVGLPTVPSGFAISHVQDQFDEDGNEVGNDGYTERFRDGKFIQELEWWARAAAREREHGVPYKT
jgi:NAD(P)H-dependent FMN reductase